MRIALDHQALRLGPDRIAAELAPADEELLLRREAVDDRLRSLALAGLQVAVERDLGPGQVADRLAQHQLAVVVHARLDEVALELLDHTLPAGLELLQVLVGPPVLQPALRVVLRALVVEAVADLVADHGAD